MRQRVQKILADVGVGSRRACEKLIVEGRVKVNGVRIKLGDQADPAWDAVTLDEQRIHGEERKTYILLNKPRGYVTTVSEPFGMRTVMELVSTKERIYPVGRLDKDSDGLLLLTNDGMIANRLTHPRYGVAKRYHVRADREVRATDTQRLLHGVRIEGRVVRITWLYRINNREIVIEIHEGRKHIVRKLFEMLGYNVTRLTRTSFGPLVLRGLVAGQWRHLTKDEKKLLFAAAGLTHIGIEKCVD